MTAMTMDFDGVRELSLDEIDAVAGGPAPIAVFVAIGVASVAVAGIAYAAGRVNGYNGNREESGGGEATAAE